MSIITYRTIVQGFYVRFSLFLNDITIEFNLVISLIAYYKIWILNNIEGKAMTYRNG